jgi:hypothetical protein
MFRLAGRYKKRETCSDQAVQFLEDDSCSSQRPNAVHWFRVEAGAEALSYDGMQSQTEVDMLSQVGTGGEAEGPAFVLAEDGSEMVVGCTGMLDVGSWSSQQSNVRE